MPMGRGPSLSSLYLQNFAFELPEPADHVDSHIEGPTTADDEAQLLLIMKILETAAASAPAMGSTYIR